MTAALLLLAIGWAGAAVVMCAFWLWHRRMENAGVVDVGWTVCVGTMGAFYAAAGPGAPWRRWMVAVMFVTWSARLAVHLLTDRVLGKREDSRYAELRARGSVAAAAMFFPFFQAQALLAVVFSIAAVIPALNTAPNVRPVEVVSVALWLCALVGETAADQQLKAFKRRPGSRGTTCRDGLWRYSRHPNYFFEWLIWVAYSLFALGSPWGFVTLACPALMLYLLLRVTGIPETEAQAVRSRGDDYRRYQETTSVFVPWWPD